jgi:hypothetical protein
MASIHRPPSADCFPPTLHRLTPDDLAAYFTAAWDSYEWLYSGVDQSSYLEHTRTHPFSNTLSFYYGHTAAFYAAKLRAAGLMSEPVADWDRAMATAVWPQAAADIADAQDWPSFHALQGYRREVRERVGKLIAGLTIPETVTEQDPVWAVLMGIEHEFIHFHLSLPLFRRVPLNRVSPPSDWTGCDPGREEIDADDWHACEGGTVSFGRVSGEHNCYGWDNEYGRKTVEVKPLYPDFSRPWFRGDHSVLLGASYAALGHMTRIGLMRDVVQNHMDQLAGVLLVRPR